MIRRARPVDVPLLAAIEDAAEAMFEGTAMAFVLEIPRLPTQAPLRALEDGLLWVSVDPADRPVGFLEAEVIGGWLHLWEMSVHPDFQRQGRAGALVEAAVAAARIRGIGTLSLTTDRHLPWNGPMYRAMGFEELEAGAIPDWLAAILAREVAHGFDTVRRLAMSRVP
jgi:GNAT superfamily N-acetyltransferase